MAYRTYVNDVQLFGNDETYPEWLEFVKAQGIAVDEDSLGYDGEITDFMGAMETCERIVMRLEEERRRDRMARHPTERPTKSLFDLRDIPEMLEGYSGSKSHLHDSLFDCLYDRIAYGYLFRPILLYSACRDSLADATSKTRFRAYRLRPGMSIHVHAG